MAVLSQVTIPVIPITSLIFPLNTWNCFPLPHNGYYFPSEIICANSFIVFPVGAGKSGVPNFPTGLALSQCFPNIVKKKRKPALLLSSFIADNFIRCQEKPKNVDTKQQLYGNFWIEEMKDSASGRWKEFNIGICEREQ